MTIFLPRVGTKNVAKELKKITSGRVRDRGVTWFPELIDKSVLCACCYMGLVCFIREEHQGTPLLGHEELWYFFRLASSIDCQHSGTLQGV